MQRVLRDLQRYGLIGGLEVPADAAAMIRYFCTHEGLRTIAGAE